MLDGKEFVSYREFVRLDENVIFSMPVGGTKNNPGSRWPRCGPISSIGRRPIDTRLGPLPAIRGNARRRDYQRLSNEVADVLNTIALSTDRPQALTIAERARKTVASGRRPLRIPAETFARSCPDAAISSLRAVGGGNPFERVARLTRLSWSRCAACQT